MVIESAVTGFIAGFLAGVLQKYTWNLIQRPELEIGEEVQKLRKRTEENEEGRSFVNTVFRVPVHNSGRTAAYNCKPILNLEGKAPLPRWVDDSAVQASSGTEVSGGRFRVHTELYWAESGRPSRITINRGSTAYFDLVLVQNIQEYEEEAEKIYENVAFPSESGWGDSSPVDMIGGVFEDGMPRPAGGDYRINRDQLTRADYTESLIEVTAENAKKATAGLAFSNKHGWPEVEIVDSDR